MHRMFKAQPNRKDFPFQGGKPKMKDITINKILNKPSGAGKGSYELIS